jgi:hypothetical protein
MANVEVWLKEFTYDIFESSYETYEIYQDCRFQKLANVIYHMIMRQGSNLQEFSLELKSNDDFIDMPKFSIFTTYNPGITNLKSLSIRLYVSDEDMKYQNVIEFISKVSRLCNGIINCESVGSNLHRSFADSFVDIMKLQPLERIMLNYYYNTGENVKKIVNALGFRSETLKELIFSKLNFENTNLSSISKLERLERLEFVKCKGFIQHYDKGKFCLKELRLWHDGREFYDNNWKFTGFGVKSCSVGAMINSFCSDSLLKLSLNIVTPE